VVTAIDRGDSGGTRSQRLREVNAINQLRKYVRRQKSARQAAVTAARTSLGNALTPQMLMVDEPWDEL